MDTWQTLALVIVPLLIGCLFTWWASRWFYRKSSKDTEELRLLALTTISSLQNAGLITVAYDAQGVPHAVAVLSGTAGGSAGASGTLTTSTELRGTASGTSGGGGTLTP
jgi:hypothetical protein